MTRAVGARSAPLALAARVRGFVLTLAALLWAQTLCAQTVLPLTDVAAATLTVQAFHEALARGDSAEAMRLLATDAVILEEGQQETRDDYRSHHLAADIAFAKAVPARVGAIQVTVIGDVAWASSTSVTRGKYRRRPVNSAGAELMVLSRTATGWEVRAIHWSSRALRRKE
ncbi:MAG: nuclear transport factor 2 family protein [Burkholderiaceae bacterium]